MNGMSRKSSIILNHYTWRTASRRSASRRRSRAWPATTSRSSCSLRPAARQRHAARPPAGHRHLQVGGRRPARRRDQLRLGRDLHHQEAAGPDQDTRCRHQRQGAGEQLPVHRRLARRHLHRGGPPGRDG